MARQASERNLRSIYLITSLFNLRCQQAVRNFTPNAVVQFTVSFDMKVKLLSEVGVHIWGGNGLTEESRAGRSNGRPAGRLAGPGRFRSAVRRAALGRAGPRHGREPVAPSGRRSHWDPTWRQRVLGPRLEPLREVLTVQQTQIVYSFTQAVSAKGSPVFEIFTSQKIFLPEK